MRSLKLHIAEKGKKEAEVTSVDDDRYFCQIWVVWRQQVCVGECAVPPNAAFCCPSPSPLGVPV